MRLSLSFALLSLAVLLTVQSVTGDWGSWRAPGRISRSRAAEPPVQPVQGPAHHNADSDSSGRARSSSPDPDASYHSDSPDPDADLPDEGDVDWRAEYGVSTSPRRHDGEAGGSGYQYGEEEADNNEAGEDEGDDEMEEEEQAPAATGEWYYDHDGILRWRSFDDSDVD